MIEKLSTFIDINQIDRAAGLLEAGYYLIKQPKTIVHNFSKWGRVIVYFQQFIQGIIDEPTFFGLGDSSTLPIYFTDIDYLQVCFDDDIDQPGVLLIDQEAIAYYQMQTASLFTTKHAHLVIL